MFKNRRSGFTMSELIIVLVIMGGLSYVTFNKLFGAKTKNEIEATIKADLEAITAACDKFRLNSREGKYTGLEPDKILGYLPNNMKLFDFNTGASFDIDDETATNNNSIGSLSFGNGCVYTVVSNNSVGATGSKNREYNLAMNCTQAIADFGWAEKEQALSEQVFWEFITQKYNYKADKGRVSPAYAGELTSLETLDYGNNIIDTTDKGTVTSVVTLTTTDIVTSLDDQPDNTNIDGIISGTQLRGF